MKLTRDQEKETGKDSKDKDNEQGKEDEGTNESSKGLEDETKSPIKPPAKPEPQPKKCTKGDVDEGMEGTTNEETSFPHIMEACCKVHKPRRCPTKRARADDCQANLASVRTRAAGDFGTQFMQERQDIIAITNQTLVARMFISLGLNDKIVATVDEQGYNISQPLSCLDQTGIEELVSANCKPGGMKDGTHNLGINFPFNPRRSSWVRALLLSTPA